MQPKRDQEPAGIRRWPGPWATSSLDTRSAAPSTGDYRFAFCPQSEQWRERVHLRVPPNARLRIRAIGITASAFATTAWALAIIWLSQLS
jgi:hypothetical protein